MSMQRDPAIEDVVTATRIFERASPQGVGTPPPF